MLEKIIEQAKQGNKAAMDLICCEHYEQVYLQVRKVFRDENQIKDIVQEVFLKVFLNLQELKSPEAFAGWLYKITLNECRQCLRKEGKQLLIDSPELLEHSEVFPIDKGLQIQNAKEFLDTIIGLLPEGQRRAIHLYYYEQLPIKTIAEIENMSVNSIKSRLAQARKKIKAAVEAEKRRVGETELPW